MSTNTFREAYGVLQKHAETLRNQREPNIDDLLNIVTESVDAYKVCKARIDAVEKALEQALGGAGVEGSAAQVAGADVGADGDAKPAAVGGSGAPPRAAPRTVSNPPSAHPSESGVPDFDAADDDVPF